MESVAMVIYWTADARTFSWVLCIDSQGKYPADPIGFTVARQLRIYTWFLLVNYWQNLRPMSNQWYKS